MDYSFSTTTVLVVLLVGVLVLMGLIFGLRKMYQYRSSTDLKAKYKGYNRKSPLAAIHQYPDVDVFSMNSIFVKLGIVLSLSLVIIALNWTVHPKAKSSMDYELSGDDDITVEMPRTMEPPPPPPPPAPKPLTFEEVKPELITEQEELEFEDQSADAETEIERPDPVIERPPEKEKVVPAPPPPPPPPPPPVETEIFKVVEEMPQFSGCEAVKDKAARTQCAQQKMLDFIKKNLVYPAVARENGIQGSVVVSFVVERDGSITDVKIIRDIGGRCGEEAVRVIKMMPKWKPGKQRGIPVRVQFYLPVRFILA